MPPRTAQTRIAVVVAGLVAALLWSDAAAAGGGVRDNPFRPDTTAEEDRTIAEENASARVMRDLLPAITQEVSRSVVHDQKAALDLLKDEMIAKLAATEAKQAQAMATSGLRSSAAPNISAMKFYACANGKALYKDSAGALVVSTPDQERSCP